MAPYAIFVSGWSSCLFEGSCRIVFCACLLLIMSNILLLLISLVFCVVLFVFVMCLVYPMLPVSLDCTRLHLSINVVLRSKGTQHLKVDKFFYFVSIQICVQFSHWIPGRFVVDFAVSERATPVQSRFGLMAANEKTGVAFWVMFTGLTDYPKWRIPTFIL
jgi:hypothetical protein